MTTAGDLTPIIMHDDTTLRCSDQSLHLCELNQHNLKTIDAGAWFAPEFTGETIPLFTDVLDWLQSNQMQANVELKRHSHQADTAAFVQPILDVLSHYRDLWPRLLITSFDEESLNYCLAHAPELTLGGLFDQPPHNWLDLLKGWGAQTVHINYKHLSDAMLLTAKQYEIKTRCYTPKAYSDIEADLYLGLTSVIVNSPVGFTKSITEQFDPE